MGSEEKGRGVYLHTIPHSLFEFKADKRQLQENTEFGDFLSLVVSGVIFQVTGVSLEQRSNIFACLLLECSAQILFLNALKQFLEQTRRKF